MTRVGFEPTTPVFERVKTAHALDRAVTVIGKGTYSFALFRKVSTQHIWQVKKCMQGIKVMGVLALLLRLDGLDFQYLNASVCCCPTDSVKQAERIN
jgi:hypothetical protein